ncbi:hypothetical protein [Entomohabitans teleogrylli]|uniref:hypothetical protein n=1 Tax=Entomohabitans teleogrylli TaxID=1384589 RepID=UPI000A4FF8CB|nr:hypothetical protein [Entomohabitans teleogrylli]
MPVSGNVVNYLRCQLLPGMRIIYSVIDDFGNVFLVNKHKRRLSTVWQILKFLRG